MRDDNRLTVAPDLPADDLGVIVRCELGLVGWQINRVPVVSPLLGAQTRGAASRWAIGPCCGSKQSRLNRSALPVGACHRQVPPEATSGFLPTPRARGRRAHACWRLSA